MYVKQMLCEKYGEDKFEFVNLGISGNQTYCLKNRWQKDCIDIQPDIVSIMIGINDVWSRCAERNWLENEVFESNYRYLLEQIKEKTKAKILILEPYLLPVEDKLYFREDLNGKIDIVRKLAREYADAYVPTDGLFAAALLHSDIPSLGGDGVHPIEGGCKLIAKHYYEAVIPLIESLKFVVIILLTVRQASRLSKKRFARLHILKASHI